MQWRPWSGELSAFLAVRAAPLVADGQDAPEGALRIPGSPSNGVAGPHPTSHWPMSKVPPGSTGWGPLYHFHSSTLSQSCCPKPRKGSNIPKATQDVCRRARQGHRQSEERETEGSGCQPGFSLLPRGAGSRLRKGLGGGVPPTLQRECILYYWGSTWHGGAGTSLPGIVEGECQLLSPSCLGVTIQSHWSPSMPRFWQKCHRLALFSTCVNFL